MAFYVCRFNFGVLPPLTFIALSSSTLASRRYWWAWWAPIGREKNDNKRLKWPKIDLLLRMVEYVIKMNIKHNWIYVNYGHRLWKLWWILFNRLSNYHQFSNLASGNLFMENVSSEKNRNVCCAVWRNSDECWKHIAS